MLNRCIRRLSPTRCRSRSASPTSTRHLSSLSRSINQAPIIPRYRAGTDDMNLPAYLTSSYAIPIPVTVTTTPQSPVHTVPGIKTHVPLPRGRGRPAKTPQPLPHAPLPLPHARPTTIPPSVFALAASTVKLPYTLPHYTNPITPFVKTPTMVYVPHTPTPTPTPMPVNAPYTYTPTPIPVHVPKYTYKPTSTPRTPISPPTAPIVPWWMAAIGMGAAVGVAIIIAKERGETVQLPPMAVSAILSSASVEVLTSSDLSSTNTAAVAGYGTKSALSSVITRTTSAAQSFAQILFSWVGMCSTFVVFCFVAVIRAKFFASTTAAGAGAGSGSDFIGLVSGSLSSRATSTSTSVPPLNFESALSSRAASTFTSPSPSLPAVVDLESARVSLDLTAQTYIEQLISYYETLALTTDRMSLSQRQKMAALE